MKLIIGLGNPGKEYENTRHNVGFMAVDFLARELEAEDFLENDKFQSSMSRVFYRNDTVLLVKPLTFMNLSGEAVQKMMSFYKIEPHDLIVIHDEMDLPLGEIRESFGKNSAGHKGIESIIEKCGTKDFMRLRIGIGKDRGVLKKFGLFEKMKIKDAVNKSADAIKNWLNENR